MTVPAPPGMRVEFRPLREADLTVLARWLSTPEWIRWWAPAIPLEEVRAKYLPRIEGEDPVNGFVVVVDGRAVGYIQWYRVSDHPDVTAVFGLDDDRAEVTAGIDFGIGEPDMTGHGHGRTILARFVEDVVLRAPGIATCVVDPDPDNERAVRCYRAAGFVERGVVVDGQTGEHWMLMEWAG
ncbi:MAG TPA: GNAT family N-acetyltransferase [Candidatus Dormibacteraeota bacterium]|nr:GNAT family N-acetyltransferase [Candidatus Dormibacteraeota bacterium]